MLSSQIMIFFLSRVCPRARLLLNLNFFCNNYNYEPHNTFKTTIRQQIYVLKKCSLKTNKQAYHFRTFSNQFMKKNKTAFDALHVQLHAFQMNRFVHSMSINLLRYLYIKKIIKFIILVLLFCS